MSIYDFTVLNPDGSNEPLEKFRGKVLLIVNTATGCGFTPQYEGLQQLYQAHKEKGFEILDFPCNQFGNQAPGTNEEIVSFCQLKYQTTFPTFGKIDVNGKNESPLFTHLKNEKKSLLGKQIKWNFTKFLVNGNGEVVKRYEPTTKPQAIESDIVKLLAAK
jgi:glutathione peroxidase